MKRWTFPFLLIWLLAGCASVPVKAKLPYDTWYLGFSAPPYMSVWVETADVEDMTGRVFYRAGSGTVSIGYGGNPAEWKGPRTMGAGKHVTGAHLPKRIYVRWQSLVEPQTYRTTLEIPDHARRLMLTKAESRAVPGKWDYQNVVAIGLAPGGAVKVLIRSPGGKPTEVLCQQAEIEPKGPNQGRHDGRYVTLPARAKGYLEHNPIPYDSWKCPGAP